ncbi:MAG: acetyl-CoA C-acetyltransferase [Rickettsiales bacterium]|nr:acetyl-CoA C-acetyltransferase [Rickettsiales bacterium]
MSEAVYIVDGVRTAIGNFLGTLKTTPAHLLTGELIKKIIKRNKLLPSDISEVILGQVLTGGAGQNPARQASIAGGIPHDVPAFLVNQVCGSGLRSIVIAAQNILLGYGDLIIAGGQENMSMSGHAAYLRNKKMGNITMVDMMLHDGLTDVFNDYHMGVTAENLVKKYKITRDEQDQFAHNSQVKASKAQKLGRFKDEIVPISIKKGSFEEDEFIRHDSEIDSLSTLSPVFSKEGTVTAGNASGINDGAAITLLTNEEGLKKYSLTPMARIVSYGISGVDPTIMGIGPVKAVKQAVIKAGWKLEDLDLIEANEAFAVQAIAVNRDLKWDTSRINVNGGAIALGHPIGASGARILVTLLYQMKRQNAKKGLATLCIGGGMGIAICIERIYTNHS